MRALPSAALLLLLAAAAADPRPRVPWHREAVFVPEPDLTDEFDGDALDESKWDPHGLRNPDTGCPKWNGPPSTAAPEYATFFPAVDDPVTGEKLHAQYKVKKGKLTMYIREKPLKFFTDREYYCNATTFSCNHDPSLRCHATDFDGNPVYADREKTQFRGVLHDKCKRAPFCIPHPEHVTRKPRVYTRYVANHLASKRAFKYGYVEARVRLPATPALTAVWLHNDDMTDGYCRWRRHEDPAIKWFVLECPSAIRSRRWQEIDVLEAMNTPLHATKYVPNIHAFAGYKGEFTANVSVDNGDGTMGGGPILLKRSVFFERRPNFSDVADERKVPNDWHYNPGSVYELDSAWAARTRTVGVYWSAREIRFYVDGEEVKRVRNRLIHQPLFLDLSNGWNVPWGKQEPTRRDTRKSRSKIFYVRTWRVFTRNGSDPSSGLPLDNKMENGFKDLYGTELKGVLGRFPVNDDRTVVQTVPAEADVMEATPGPVEGAVSGRAWRDAGGDYVATGADAGAAAARQAGGDETLEQAGGAGNRRFSRERGRMSAAEKRIALGNPDRMAVVPQPGAEPRTVTDAAITVFEFADPNKDGAAWATRGGTGTGMSMA